MTFEEQHIEEDMYSGNYKEVGVTIWEDEAKTQVKDLTSARLVYVILTDEKVPEVVLTKASFRGDSEIEILSPATNGICVVKLFSLDTLHLNGTYRHQMNMEDSNGHVETVMTGRIRIFKSFALIHEEQSVSAYLEGG
jgi:hypothetical protein